MLFKQRYYYFFIYHFKQPLDIYTCTRN